jgi:hypothetical protein
VNATLRGAAAIALAFGLLAERNASGQETAAPPPALTGHWSGSAKLTDESAATPCQYAGTADPPSVTLDISGDAAALKGKVTLDLAPPAESACPPLRATYDVQDITISGNSLRFSDSAGRRWDLGLALEVLKGIVSSEGTLSGEVSLKRSGAPTAQGQTPATSTPATGGQPAGGGSASPGGAAGAKAGGSFLSGVGGVVAANVIGLGALFGINKLANEKNQTGNGMVTCSPRSCVAGAPGDPCFCNTTLASGGSCGSTASGVPFAMACSVPAMPCQSDLSCNNGICEDKFGTCPF